MRSEEIFVIRPRGALVLLDLAELWQFRDLLAAFSSRDIRLRYRQTALGGLWVILQPLLGALVFAFVLGVIAHIPTSGAPYFIVAYSGMLGWTLFSGSITRISNCLVANASLIRKVFFPRLLLPLGVLPCVLLDFAVGLALMAVFMSVYRIQLQWGLLCVPLSVLVLVILAFGAGMIAASLAVKYRDIQYVVPLLMQLLMYASPVGYSVGAVPLHLKSLYLLNPLAAPLENLRWALIGAGTPQLGYLAYSGLIGIGLVAGGLITFRHFEREFADVI